MTLTEEIQSMKSKFAQLMGIKESVEINELSPELMNKATRKAFDTGRTVQGTNMKKSEDELGKRDAETAKNQHQNQMDQKFGQFYGATVSFYKSISRDETTITNTSNITSVTSKTDATIFKINFYDETCAVFYSQNDDVIKVVGNTVSNILDRKGAMVVLKIIKIINPATKLNPQSGNMGQIVGIHAAVPRNTAVNEARRFVLGKGYTHFLIYKGDNKIVDGWEYGKDMDKESIAEYVKMDMADNDYYGFTKKDFKCVTRKFLERQGINPADTNNWHKSVAKTPENMEQAAPEAPAPDLQAQANARSGWGGPVNEGKGSIGAGYGGTLNEQLNKLSLMNQKLNGVTSKMNESMYDSKGNFLGGPDPRENNYNDSDQEDSFETESHESDGMVTVFYIPQLVPSGIKREMKLAGVDVTKVVDNQTGQMINPDLNDLYHTEALRNAKFKNDAGNESLYGI